MHDESTLDELLLKWEESLQGPTPLEIDELCHSFPELREPLRQRIAQLAWVDEMLGDSTHMPPIFEAGQLVGRYCLEQYLGAGGFGQVWKAYDPELDRHVAVKLLHPHRVAEARHRDSVLVEARNLASLQHQNIVAIFDAGRDHDMVYLVTELVKGESLQTLLDNQSVDPAQAVSIVRDIGQALQHAHAAGIVHRDVKPGNILVDGQGRAHLTDFGIAFSATQKNSRCRAQGSLGYMAPEQAGTIDWVVGPACDIYALGRVLIAALSRTSHLRETLAKSPQQNCDDLARWGIGDKLGRVCLQATAHYPDDRYASADEFLAALDMATAPADRARLNALLGTIILITAFAVAGGFWAYHAKRGTTTQPVVTENDAAVESLEFQHNFDMFGDYNKHLISSENAKVYTEPDGVTRYWCPTDPQIAGIVIYGYDLGFEIKSASVAVRLEAHGPYSSTRLDVSPDMKTWTGLAVNDIPDLPRFDVSHILEGSHTAYVRAIVQVERDGVHFAQFLRTNPGLYAPNVYNFQASGEARFSGDSRAKHAKH